LNFPLTHIEIMFIVDIHPFKCIPSTWGFDQKYNCKPSCKTI